VLNTGPGVGVSASGPGSEAVGTASGTIVDADGPDSEAVGTASITIPDACSLLLINSGAYSTLKLVDLLPMLIDWP
jgi:hypothetical protein